jgi:hypothetical protein
MFRQKRLPKVGKSRAMMVVIVECLPVVAKKIRQGWEKQSNDGADC